MTERGDPWSTQPTNSIRIEPSLRLSPVVPSAKVKVSATGSGSEMPVPHTKTQTTTRVDNGPYYYVMMKL